MSNSSFGMTYIYIYYPLCKCIVFNRDDLFVTPTHNINKYHTLGGLIEGDD